MPQEKPPVKASVVWPDGAEHPSVEPYTIGVTAKGQEIQWTCGHHVAGFVIWCLDPVEFWPAASKIDDPDNNPWVKEFTTRDANNHQGTFTYKVRALHTSGSMAEHDPRIQNGSG
jgi:hypothetical protein